MVGSGAEIVVSPSETTEYTVTATLNGCSAEAMATVTVFDVPEPTIDALPATVCLNDEPVALSGDNPAGGDFSGTGVTSTSSVSCPEAVWINEIHYDNDGSDTGEGVEIDGTTGTELAGYEIVLYNGSTGTQYNTETLSGTIGDEGAGFGAINFPISGIQNGAPDGCCIGRGNLLNEVWSLVGIRLWSLTK